MSPETLSLAGKVAIITGSGRENGIGAAIAIALSRNGAAVTINHVSDSSAPRAEAIAEKIRQEGGKAIVIQASVDKAGAKKLVHETIKAFGGIDILVNNAGTGITPPTDTLSQTPAKLLDIFSVNVFGAIYMVQAVIPHIRPGGRIINISSIAQKVGMTIAPIYNATKAALDTLAFTWAGEFGKSHHITVNSLGPGPVLTDLVSGGHSQNSNAPAPEGQREAVDDMLKQTRAEHRIGTPQDVSDAVLLIVQERARWITGQYIDVSGGVTNG